MLQIGGGKSMWKIVRRETEKGRGKEIEIKKEKESEL